MASTKPSFLPDENEKKIDMPEGTTQSRCTMRLLGSRGRGCRRHRTLFVVRCDRLRLDDIHVQHILSVFDGCRQGGLLIVVLRLDQFHDRFTTKLSTRFTRFHLFEDRFERLQPHINIDSRLQSSAIQCASNRLQRNGIGNIAIEGERQQPLHENISGLLQSVLCPHSRLGRVSAVMETYDAGRGAGPFAG